MSPPEEVDYNGHLYGSSSSVEGAWFDMSGHPHLVLCRIRLMSWICLPCLLKSTVRRGLFLGSTPLSFQHTMATWVDLTAHKIPLLDDVPVQQCYGHIPPSDYEVVREHINKLIESQVIRESGSPYASPIVMVKKKKMAVSTCVSTIDNKTRKDAFHRPCIEESLDTLTGACWFSTMDLASGYNQVPVVEATTFTDDAADW